jgi:arginine deiminase
MTMRAKAELPLLGEEAVRPTSSNAGLLPGIRVEVRSEYLPLKTVLVHEPGPEVERLTRRNRDQLLFKDIPHPHEMRKEHSAFLDHLRGCGVEVLLLGDLLLDILQDEETKRSLTEICCKASSQPALADVILDFFSAEDLKDLLLSGITRAELARKTGMRFGRPRAADGFLLWPSPNSYFCRDLAAAVAGDILSCRMMFRARALESLIVREIFRSHPLFEGAQVLYGPYQGDGRDFSIEGGDIAVINEGAIMVASGERTTPQAVSWMAKYLFEAGSVQRVYEVRIPRKRVYMHLDTVLAIIDHGLVVAYADVVERAREICRYEPIVGEGLRGKETLAFRIQEERDLYTILEDEFGHLTVINTAGDCAEQAAREQQASGNNLLAIKPGVVITYGCNLHTNRALRAEGVETVEIKGSELSKGLGGPHCMAMPLERSA